MFRSAISDPEAPFPGTRLPSRRWRTRALKVLLAALPALALAAAAALVSCSGSAEEGDFRWGPDVQGSLSVLEDLHQEGGGAGGYPVGPDNAIKVLVFHAGNGFPMDGATVVLGAGMDTYSKDTGPDGMAEFAPYEVPTNVDVGIVTATQSGFENCTFLGYFQNTYAIPLRPRMTDGLVQATGTVGSMTSAVNTGWRGMVDSDAAVYASDSTLEATTIGDTDDSWAMTWLPGWIRFTAFDAPAGLPGYAMPDQLYYEDLGHYDAGTPNFGHDFGMSFNTYDMYGGTISPEGAWGDPLSADPICLMRGFFDDPEGEKEWGVWIPLTLGFGPLDTNNAPYSFDVRFLDLGGAPSYQLMVGLSTPGSMYPYGAGCGLVNWTKAPTDGSAPQNVFVPSPCQLNSPMDGSIVNPPVYLEFNYGGHIPGHWPTYVILVEEDGPAWPANRLWRFFAWSGGSTPVVPLDIPLPDTSNQIQIGFYYRWWVESWAPEGWVLPDNVMKWKTLALQSSGYTRSDPWHFQLGN